MSVTSQLRNKAGPLWMFFEENESTDGIKSITTILKATSIPDPPPYKGSFPYSITGTAFSYVAHILLPTARIHAIQPFIGTILEKTRYKQEFKIDRSIAFKSADDKFYPYWDYKELIDEFLSMATDMISNKKDINSVAKGSIILAILEISVRGGSLPESLTYLYEEHDDVKKCIDIYLEKGIQYQQLVDDTVKIARIFLNAIKSSDNDLKNAKFCYFGKALHHSVSVGGADIDVALLRNGKISIIDFKTILKPVDNTVTRQILSYALLWNKHWDGGDVGLSNIGVYYSRAGELREIPVADAIKLAFPSLSTLSEARKRLGVSFSEYAERIGLMREQRSISELKKILGR